MQFRSRFRLYAYVYPVVLLGILDDIHDESKIRSAECECPRSEHKCIHASINKSIFVMSPFGVEDH